MSALPSPDVLDRFAVPAVTRVLDGGQGGTVLAGDLALSPQRDAARQAWLSPLLARLAYELDLIPGRRPLRLAMPVPARDGEWVVDGWGATRYEPDCVPCTDLDVILATARLLHARFASLIPLRPAAFPPADQRQGSNPDTGAAPGSRWDRAEAIAFAAPDRVLEDQQGARGGQPLPEAVRPVLAALRNTWLGPSQLVHRDLASNVLLDPRGSALVIDVTPTWRPTLWAEAVCLLDCVTWQGAPLSALTPWRAGRERQAMLRALVFRMLSDRPLRAEAYHPALEVVLPSRP